MKRSWEREIDSESQSELMIYGNLLGTLYFLVMGTDQSLLFVVVRWLILGLSVVKES